MSSVPERNDTNATTGKTVATGNESTNDVLMDDSAPAPGWALRELLKQSGVQEWDPRVVMQLLEFQYRTTHDILLSCKDYAAHDGRKQLTEDDLQLGVQEHFSAMRKPPRAVLAQIQKKINKAALPPITAATGHGLRLPDARACLTSDNFGRDAIVALQNDKNTNNAPSGISSLEGDTAMDTGNTGDTAGSSSGNGSGGGGQAIIKPPNAHDRYNVTRVPVNVNGATERKSKVVVVVGSRESAGDNVDTRMDH